MNMVIFCLSIFMLENLCLHCTAGSKGRKKSPEGWTGSQIGTTNYKNEVAVIREAQHDLLTARIYDGRKNILCTVFIKATLHPGINLLANMMQMGKTCDWAVVIYGGENDYINNICQKKPTSVNIVHCQRSQYYIQNSLKAIPKTVLYTEVLYLLPEYKRVFLMDEDMSLLGFDMPSYLTIWDCAFPNQPPPLVVQPLISESTQYFKFFSKASWMGSGVLASAVGLVEQQIPAFDSVFFEWFVRRVLSQTLSVALEHGVDWGHDRSWCNAARMYTRDVLHWPKESVPCALLVGATPVHHMNTHSMENKRSNVTAFRERGVRVVQHYIDLFPTWVQIEILRSTNPLDRTRGSEFLKVKALNQTCVRSMHPGSRIGAPL